MRSLGVGLGTVIWWGSIAFACILTLAGVVMLGFGNNAGISVIGLGVVALVAGYYVSRRLPQGPGPG